MHSSWIRSAMAAAVLALGGCGMRISTANPERPPEPPPFTAAMMTMEEVHSTMWELADRTQRINRLLRGTDAGGTVNREAVVQLLDEMLAVSERLTADDARAGHPVLARNIDGFRDDVRLARNGAAATPPNYFLAGSIAGACANCHGPGYGKVH